MHLKNSLWLSSQSVMACMYVGVWFCVCVCVCVCDCVCVCPSAYVFPDSRSSESECVHARVV